MSEQKRVTFNLLGPQGSGKGTQAEALVEHFGFAFFGAGENLRKIRATGSPLGKEIASYIDKGNMVPPELISRLIHDAVSEYPLDQDILFDSVMRVMPQVHAQELIFEELNLEQPVIIFLDLDLETAIKRVSLRRICSQCGETTVVKEGEVNELCPNCGGKLEIRHDDEPAAVKQRLELYRHETMPVIEYFRSKDAVLTIDGRPSIPEVTAQCIEAVTAYYQKIGRKPPKGMD